MLVTCGITGSREWREGIGEGRRDIRELNESNEAAAETNVESVSDMVTREAMIPTLSNDTIVAMVGPTSTLPVTDPPVTI